MSVMATCMVQPIFTTKLQTRLLFKIEGVDIAAKQIFIILVGIGISLSPN